MCSVLTLLWLSGSVLTCLPGSVPAGKPTCLQPLPDPSPSLHGSWYFRLCQGHHWMDGGFNFLVMIPGSISIQSSPYDPGSVDSRNIQKCLGGYVFKEKQIIKGKSTQEIMKIWMEHMHPDHQPYLPRKHLGNVVSFLFLSLIRFPCLHIIL